MADESAALVEARTGREPRLKTIVIEGRGIAACRALSEKREKISLRDITTTLQAVKYHRAQKFGLILAE